MSNTPNKRKRIPSTTVILPPACAKWAVTDPQHPENKFDPANKNWSIRLEWEGDARAEVEKLLGPLLPQALEAKKAELIEEAGDNAIKRKRAEEMEYETPWREVLNRETAEPTGAIEIVLKRAEYKLDRFTKAKVRNSPPMVVDASLQATSAPIPNGAIVVAKMATWPVYFAQDNKAGIKRLLESIQIVSMPVAKTPDASGFERYEDGWTGDAPGSAEGQSGEGRPASSGADY